MAGHGTAGKSAPKPNLAAGTPAGSLADGQMVVGTVGDDEVLLARSGDRYFAVRPTCTHYKGALADGVIVDGTVRCPLHHACFDLATGDALRAPALDPLSCWRVERAGDTVFVREKLGAPPERTAKTSPPKAPASIGIVGGGAAGSAAAEMLRRAGYDRPIAVFSADSDVPVDRPNLSKDYLAGEAQDDWIPLWPKEWYEEQRIELALGSPVAAIEPASRTLVLGNGSRRQFGALLIATGADPVRLSIPGVDETRVHYLRSFADSRKIVDRLSGAKHVVVIGASFIGLEVAASLRAREIAVDVVAPEAVPLERVMGSEVGRFVQSIHESHGVVFRLGRTVQSASGRTLTLSDGSTLEADLIVVGVGVRPSVALAETAGLKTDKGILVDEFLETSEPGVFAAGDVARWPDARSGGDRIRVEHWVVAQRMGQTAARNMLGRRERFDPVPFFWSQHYDVTIRYIGHAEKWDAVRVDGSLDKRDASVSFLLGGRTLAVATVGRDRENLRAELQLERH
jgi:NADPH-dependent 2,4-dienoyl-CoA reductase/sulfur reductase-like enzyme/nitrite reductase/ring-hydroxylating ferredoxin subunit